MPIEHGGDIFTISRDYGWDWRNVLDFSASINPLGPAPAVASTICAAIDRIVHYPEPEPVRLRHALAELWSINEDLLLLGNGATELIFFAARVLGQENVAIALPVFSEFRRAFPHARTADLYDPWSWPGSGLLVLTRPANPTGYTFPIHQLRGRDQPMLIDESFLEFSDAPSAATLLNECPRLMILRSLTKFYALPGLRVGALLASEALASHLRAHREPWQVNVLAEAAALAAVADREHAARTVAFVREEREWLASQIRGLSGCQPQPSDANFLCVHLSYAAARLQQHLLAHKILIRIVSPECIRAAVRTREENERLIAAWKALPCV